MKSEFAYFGGGCFWCTEAIFQSLRGVIKVTSGYAGGFMAEPGYHDVSSGQTGHAEVIRVEFDPKEISYEVLLEIFWNTHNPTSLNRQGNDIGTQYRSIILYVDDKQKSLAENSLKKLKGSGQFESQIVTEIVKLNKFYEAESYHQNYYKRNKEDSYCQIIINPKLQKLRQKYSRLLTGDN